MDMVAPTGKQSLKLKDGNISAKMYPMCVCMCVRARACGCVRACACVRVCSCVCARVCVRACLRARACVLSHVHILQSQHNIKTPNYMAKGKMDTKPVYVPYQNNHHPLLAVQ